jgi:PKD repeat protein
MKTNGRESEGNIGKKLLVVMLVVILAAAFAVILQFVTDEGDDSTTRQGHPFEYSVSEEQGAFVVKLVSIYGEDSSDYDMTTKYGVWKNNNIVYPTSGAEEISTVEDVVIDDTEFVSYSDKDNDGRLSADDEFRVSKELATDDGFLLGISDDPSVDWYWLKLKTSEGGSEMSRSPKADGVPSMAVKLDQSDVSHLEGLPAAEDHNLMGTPRPVDMDGEPVVALGSEDNPDPMNPGTITVIGRFLFLDENSAWQPLRWASVDIYDAEWYGNDLLGTVLTGSDGRFSYGPVNNDDGLGQNGYDIKVRARLHTSATRVRNGGTYDGWTPEYSNRPDGTLDVGDWGPPTGEEGAWCIFDAITDGWDYLKNHGPNYEMEKSTTEFPEGTWPHYHRDGNIHLPDNDAAFSPDIVVHEYGHNVMWVVYGDWMPTTHCPDPHFLRGTSHTNCAWTEGWANFLPLAVYDDSVLTYRNEYALDFEPPTWGSANWDDGDDVEGRVAGGLWDIYDSVDDGDDTISNGFLSIWDSLEEQNDHKLSEYWDYFKGDHSSIAQGSKAAFYQNTIDYNNAPNTPSGLKDLSLRETDHTPPVYWSNTGDPDSEDTVTYYVYSKDETINTYDEDLTTTGTSGSLNRWTWDDGESGRWKVRAWDGLEWSAYSISDLFAMNDPPDTPTNPTDLGNNLIDHTPAVSWTASTGNNDYGTDDDVTYYVYSKDETFNTWELDFTTTGTSGTLDRWTWSDGEWGAWRVQACDPYECSAFTTADYFSMNIPPTADAGVNQIVDEGDVVTFNGAGSFDPDGTIVSYDWTFGDGGAGTGVSPTHIYGDNGVYIVTLTVTDDSAEIGTDSMTVTVYNVAPTVSIAPTSIDEFDVADLMGHATDPGSDDLMFEWSWSYFASCDTTTTYLNDILVGPDPYPSPTVNPRDITEPRSCQYGDNGVYTVTLTVTDDDGGSTLAYTNVTVNNVDPVIDPTISAYVLVDVTLRATGEKWHDVDLTLYEDVTIVGATSVIRWPGDPDDQSSTVPGISMDILACSSSAKVEYTPLDDVVNGQEWGGTPVFLILTFEDGREVWLDHTFNVRHPHKWVWMIPDFCPYIDAVGLPIYFEASATDVGSDDLTFTWSWGDSTPDDVATYYNGVGPDPYPSPDISPMAAADATSHTYTSPGTYIITLTVTDDDGGMTSVSFNLTP